MDKVRGIYCRHIEDKMPKRSSGQSVKAYPSNRIEDYWLREVFLDRKPIPEYEIATKLKEFGLDKYEVELIMTRYIEEKRMKTVVNEQGWLSVNSAAYHLRKALKKLRDGGFKLR